MTNVGEPRKGDRLAGVVALVTGGSQGFGSSIVRQFSLEGAKVISVDLSYTAQDDGKPIEGLEGALRMKGDVTLEQTWQEASQRAQSSFGRPVNCVVNNAVNVKSIYLSVKVLVPIMRQYGKGGSFIQISSTAAIRPRPQLTWYNASKGAVSTASKAMALEYAKDQIRFNCINPVAGNTPLLSKFAGAKESGDQLTDAQLKQFHDSVPLGRLSEGTDIANACVFLADPKSAFISGIDLPVDGGRCV